jgi:DNA-directed RNA polymerase specialized sigma subunit
MNKVKILNRTNLVETINTEIEEIPYDWERDTLINQTHQQVMNELQALERTRMWPQAKIFQIYFDSEDTMEQTARKIGISKSTTFLAIKKIRSYLKEVIPNPNEKT